jgi:aldose sugar dehydrogenase
MRLLTIAMIIMTVVLFSSFIFARSVHFVYGFDNTMADRIAHNKSVTKNLESIDLDSIVKQQKISNNPKWISNPEFIFLDNQSGKVIYGLPSYWNYSTGSCEKNNFKCTINTTSGWKDKAISFQISTNKTDKNTWSSIYGNEISVNAGEQYALATHMKLNEFATASHITIEGYNETSKKWNQIMLCPIGVNGPVEWRGFSCAMTIPASTNKIRPVLNAGWSSQPGKEAVTLFGPIYLTNWEFAPIVNDPNLKVELVSKGLEMPVIMSFLGPNDFLVTENGGKVQRIVNGVESKNPLLDVAVTKTNGMLGIAVAKHENGPTYVFLYMESVERKSGNDNKAELKPKCNCLYRYELVNDKLVNPKLLLDLPAYSRGVEHNGGIIKIGPDNNVYLSGGDFGGLKTLTENFRNNNTAIGGGIYKISQNGQPVGNILGNTDPLNKFYAYGIRESFGMDFDPVAKNLWDTENGPNFGDEINLVKPGFNSGSPYVDGIWKSIGENQGPIALHPERDLVDFGERGKYGPPEFTWKHTVGPTALAFLNSTRLGKQYENDMFVGDFNNGSIYHFKLNKNRMELVLNGSLAGKIANQPEELQASIFATAFGGITDLKVGPDGYLYAISMDKGKIYRIVPDNKLS